MNDEFIKRLSRVEKTKYIDELLRMRAHVMTALKRAPAAATVKLIETNLELLTRIHAAKKSLENDKVYLVEDWIGYASMLEQAIRNFSEEDYQVIIMSRPKLKEDTRKDSLIIDDSDESIEEDYGE